MTLVIDSSLSIAVKRPNSLAHDITVLTKDQRHFGRIETPEGLSVVS